MPKILAHRGMWSAIVGQNTKESINHAQYLSMGVELDLRLKDDIIYLSHDEVDIQTSDTLESVLPILFIESFYPPIAFHLKDNIKLMLPILQNLLVPYLDKYKNFFFFGFLSITELNMYLNVFGADAVAYELELGRKGSLREGAKCAAKKIWLVSFTNKYPLRIFRILANKEIYATTPELVGNPDEELSSLYFKYMKGICTDYVNLYANKIA